MIGTLINYRGETILQSFGLLLQLWYENDSFLHHFQKKLCYQKDYGVIFAVIWLKSAENDSQGARQYLI